MKQKKQSRSYSAPALDKGLDILELLSTYQEGLTQGQIATKLNKSVNEIYRMISTLRSREYVDLDEETDIYYLSYKILNMTAKFEPIKTLMLRAIPLMKEITTKTNQSIHLAIYTRGKILIVAQEDSPSFFNYHMSVGATFDLLETSSGRVLLTFQKENERKRRLERRKFYLDIDKNSNILKSDLKKIENKFTKNTIHKIIKNRCEVVKSLQIRGVTNISVPVFDYSENAIAALTIPFVDRIISKGELNIKQVTHTLQNYGEKLSVEMGYRNK
ncbi:helix-turn-helix domain-containing protein [Alphaproteobacteria bacterium]|nr:helix-turn-helix domain-containing protein [Alphaproteobacteria bacterium]